jgi:capsular exopolysaccharide synthesis family protein
MELSEYVKIAKRRWLLITLLVVAALAIVYWTSPPKVTDSYDATNMLLVEAADGQGNAADANPQVVALRATVGEVPTRAATKLEYEGDPATLAAQVTATADRALSTVSITASDEDPARAALIANTFSEEVVAYLQEQEAAETAAQSEAAATRETELRAQIAELNKQIAAEEPESAAAATLTSDRDLLNRQLGQLLDTQQEQATPVEYTVLQPASTAVQQDRLPGTSSREQRMLLAGLVALVLGFGLAVVLDRSDSRLRTRREAEARFGLPVIAEIPALSLPKRRRKVVVAEEPDSVKAEAYRTLRAAVMLYRRKDDDATFARPRHERVTRGGVSGNGRRARPDRDVILITSPGAGDGKTTTVANLAVAYAESGRSVLVLSGDLWRSSVARRLGVKPSRGVSDFLASDGATPLSSYVRKTSVPGVQVVTGGLAIRRPGGRLLAEQRLIDEAHRLADVVIIDTAPLLAASLTRELTTMVDAVVVVSRVGRTTAADAEQCADLLEQLGAPTLGVVMVGVTTPLFSDYFSYAAPRRTRRLAAEEAAEAEAEDTLPDEIDGHEQADLQQPGPYSPPSPQVGAGQFEPPGDDR